MVHLQLKRWRIRLSLGLLLASAITLIDEAVKEGYVFDPSDVAVPWITHEKIFLVLFLSALILGVRR